MKNRTGEDKYVMWDLFQEVRCLEGKQKERVEKRMIELCQTQTPPAHKDIQAMVLS